MRIGFFGTPEIAAYCLDKLAEKHEISFVVTGADKPAGRNRILKCSPVKEAGLSRNFFVYQPDSLNDIGFIEELKSRGADIFVVVAYGRILPRSVFALPRYGTVNLHPSLLPAYRGAAPVEWAVINGENETGISIQMMNERLDEGDIVLQRVIPIDIDITAGELYDIILPVGVELLLESLDMISSSKTRPAPQDNNQATYCGKIDRETARINWAELPLKIHNLVRGLNPKPAAWTSFKGKNIKILRTSLFDAQSGADAAPGEIMKCGKKRLLAGTGGGFIEILELQPETKKTMDALSFLNGYRIGEGDVFGV